MTDTSWSPDTCDCTVNQDPPWVWTGTIEKCKLHKHLDGQKLMDALKKHRLPFNTKPNEIVPNDFIDEAKKADVSIAGWAFQKGRKDILAILKRVDAREKRKDVEVRRIRRLK